MKKKPTTLSVGVDVLTTEMEQEFYDVYTTTKYMPDVNRKSALKLLKSGELVLYDEKWSFGMQWGSPGATKGTFCILHHLGG